jgi:hypothetical protein
MATPNTTFQSSKSKLPAVSGFAILSICVNALDAAEAQFSHLLGALSGELFKVLPSIILADCRRSNRMRWITRNCWRCATRWFAPGHCFVSCFERLNHASLCRSSTT